MNLLVTGGTGFIGSHVVRRLVRDKHYVVLLKRKSSNLARIKEILKKPNLKLYDIEHTSLESLYENERLEGIIHLATYYRKQHFPDELKTMIRTNIEWPAEILQFIKNSRIKFFINTGTFFEYDLSSQTPCSEKHETRPFNLYASTKLALMKLLDFYTNEYGLSACTLRLFAPYGPKDHKSKLIPYSILKFKRGEPISFNSTGNQIWDYVYVDDIVEAFVKAINYCENFHPKNEVINIGSGKGIILRGLIGKIAAFFNVDPDSISWNSNALNDVAYAVANIDKAKRLLKWKPKTSLDEGIEKTIKWFLEALPEKDFYNLTK